MAAKEGDDTALRYLRVLDLSTKWGMYASKVLADLGADVLKVEPPGGSSQRKRGPYFQSRPDLDRSLYFWYQNTGKRSAVYDLDQPAEQERLRALAAGADVLVEGYPVGYLEERGLGYARLRELNPGLVYVSITPFGQTGPYRDFEGDDIVAAAMGGLMYLGGSPEGPPLQPGGAGAAINVMQADAIAGLGAMLGLAIRDRTGFGQHVDVSMQEAIAFANENALGFYAVAHNMRHRTGNRTWSGSGPAAQRCRDGWIMGAANFATYDLLLALRDIDSDAVPDWMTRKWWDSTERIARAQTIGDVLEAFYLRHDGEELFEKCQARRIRLGPIRTAEQVAADRQFRDRGFWVEVDHPELNEKLIYPGAPYRFSLTPHRIAGRAPLLGEHNGQGWLCPERVSYPVPQPAGHEEYPMDPERPLADLLVVDFSWQAAAPLATKYLAALGATVVKLEFSGHPDFLRLAPAPRIPGNMSPEVSHIFANFNTNKLGFNVNLTRPEGRDLVRALVARADIVLDNYGVDPFPKWGMTYDDLVKIKPDLIMLRSSVMGRTGPCSDYSTTGNVIASFTGLNMMMGFEGEPPVGMGTAHPDYSSNPHHTAIALLVALHHRRRTGLGQYIDLSQAESTAAFWGHALMEFTVNGVNPPRLGNRSLWSAPHGAYRCAADGEDDDRWIAIACDDESQWRALAAELTPDLLDDPRFSRLEDRIANAQALDERVGEAARSRDAYELMSALQARGVPAGVVQNHRDLLERDPQLRERGYYVWLEHPALGRIPHDGLPLKLSETPGKIHSPAPLQGQHTDAVLRDFLHLGTADIEALHAAGIVERPGELHG